MPKSGFNPRENLGFLLAKASQRWNELLYERFCAAGYEEVRPAYGSILVPLFEEDGLQMGELARRARLSKQTMTTLISTMEKKGLIHRSRDPKDARAFRVYLTDRSRRFMNVAKKVLSDMDRAVHGHVPGPQFEKLRGALKTLMNMSVGSSVGTNRPFEK
ncbi:MAG TPA: MarR family transcriptional regulator [Candidatus Solibacter sp.]|nr:MarR family transcriptional regulator [Candidatus Solibacter sp.]